MALIWGFAGPIIKITLKNLPADIFLLYRFLISSIIALIYFLLKGFRVPRNIKVLLMIVIYGFLTTTASLGLLFWGMEKTTLLDMSLIQSIGPLILIISGYIFLKEKITKKERVGIFIAFVGSAIVVLEPLLKSGIYANGQLMGNALIFCALLTNAAASILLKKLLRKNENAMDLANMSFIIGFITLIPFLIGKHNPIQIFQIIISASLYDHLGVLYMAIFSGTIAYTLFNLGQKAIEVSEAALFSYLYPIFSAFLAVVWLKESPTPIFIAGSIIIASGVVIAEMKHKLL